MFMCDLGAGSKQTDNNLVVVMLYYLPLTLSGWKDEMSEAAAADLQF